MNLALGWEGLLIYRMIDREFTLPGPNLCADELIFWVEPLVLLSYRRSMY
jgi:hypothetical protein